MKPTITHVFLRILVRLLYRPTVFHSDNVPAKGGALLISNHVSFVDMLLILASTHRFVRFLLPEEICQRWWLKPWLRWLRVIALPPRSRPREMLGALHAAREAVRQGDVVGMFPEGSVSRTGLILPFRGEFERIMQGVDAPIIPVCIDGMWGSIFSYQSRRFFWKLPRRLRYPVTVTYGYPLPPTTTAIDAHAAIQELSTDAWPYRRKTMKPLHRIFIQRARRSPTRLAWADASMPRLSFGSALMKVVFLALRLRSHWSGQEMVGILLPPSVAGALVNFTALLLGKVPVNLNYTLADELVTSCARQCKLQTVLTSKTFLDRVKVKIPCRTLLLEEVAAEPRPPEKLFAFVLAWFAPAGVLEKAVGRDRPGTLDDPATVIFSSGSTGEPKGVMLTHYNIVSNAEQMAQAFDLEPADRILGILPFFHALGFTGTLITPTLIGVGVAYHPNPLDAKPLGELVRQYHVTHIITTPTFLQIYLRSCDPADFGSLRMVMVGAEKLPERLASAFEDRFGIRPVEGYGCTECSPVIAANTRHFRAPGICQLGSRRGRIGRPLPGVSVRIVSPDSGEPLPPGQPGLLMVRGPNVMLGYLAQPHKTAEVMRNGWYVTGDIATLDEDGFLEITDRLSRFSKIGGEMVPHGKVEEKLHEAAGTTDTTFVVCGVPDQAKGERLIVVHTLPDDRVEEVLKRLQQLGLPNLWIPRGGAFVHVDELPRLATGKVDLRSIRQLAIQFVKEQERHTRQ